jgi:hypothetical protein
VTRFEWLMFAMAVALNAKSVRFGLMAQGIFLALLASVELRRENRPAWKPKELLWLRLLVATLSVVVICFKLGRSNSLVLPFMDRFKVDTSYFPEEAVDVLTKLNPQMNVFNSFGFGGYLAWRWGGKRKIFFHGFSTNFKFYEDNYNLPQENQAELDKVINKYSIGVFLLSKLGNDNNFINLLNQHPGWQKIREDDAAVVFAKRDARLFP